MLSSRARLQARQGQDAPPRHEYLQQLVNEFQRSPDVLRQEEVVAHLANFAYDPINYTSFCALRIMDLFLDILAVASPGGSTDVNETHNDDSDVCGSARKGPSTTTSPRQLVQKRSLVEFALGGICNCISDPQLQQQFIDGDGVELLVPFVLDIPPRDDDATPFTRSELNVVVSSLTIAYFLLDSRAFAAITSDPIVAKMRQLQQQQWPRQSVVVVAQISNTAAAFLARYKELLAV
ncbi:unnamed protein product [Hyaloperonospora brassicae]|uniref:Uncharacterized protein n=1 Tax=Hyaloperonospora brassicae TaxID=162125 RepID=A0AAV0U5H1_HYABA|nr:unnamed protein product [Hyaloperonospora brassicae]CAI5732127.1 unnamed protein product [Hyaloperonospora brassicae]